MRQQTAAVVSAAERNPLVAIDKERVGNGEEVKNSLSIATTKQKYSSYNPATLMFRLRTLKGF